MDRVDVMHEQHSELPSFEGNKETYHPLKATRRLTSTAANKVTCHPSWLWLWQVEVLLCYEMWPKSCNIDVLYHAGWGGKTYINMWHAMWLHALVKHVHVSAQQQCVFAGCALCDKQSRVHMLITSAHRSHICVCIPGHVEQYSVIFIHIRSRVFDADHMQVSKYMQNPKQPNFHKSPQKST